MLLLNPGPVTLSERVRRSLLQPDLCHRESEFFDLQDEARSRLLKVYGLDPGRWAAVLMTGSGTAAVESMMASLVAENGRVLVVENGVYGERIAQMCARYHIAHERLTGSWMEAPSLEAIRARLEYAAGEAAFTHLAVIHHETTTGRLNDLRALAQLCQGRDLQLLVDGVSSFGAEELDFDQGRLAAVAATANKCLHGVPGVSFVIVRREALARAASRTYAVHARGACLLRSGRSATRVRGARGPTGALPTLFSAGGAGEAGVGGIGNPGGCSSRRVVCCSALVPLTDGNDLYEAAR
jgi:2-aminoethylphosphonate-pyruvate transaminase